MAADYTFRMRLFVSVLVAAIALIAAPHAQTKPAFASSGSMEATARSRQSAPPARGGGYPKSVVMLATHSSPGGGSDVFLREMAPYLARIMGVRFVVDNLAGGSGAKAMAVLAKAKPDGGMFYATTPTFIYTSLLSTAGGQLPRPRAAGEHLLRPRGALHGRGFAVQDAAATSSTHARTGKGKWGAANPASLERQVMERLKQKAGVNAGRRDVRRRRRHADQRAQPHARHGHRRAAGDPRAARRAQASGCSRWSATSACRSFPTCKTVKEQGIDLSVRKFRGLAGPKGTPPEVIAAWEAAMPKLLADPAYKQIYTKNSLQPGFIPHAEYVKFMNEFGRADGGVPQGVRRHPVTTERICVFGEVRDCSRSAGRLLPDGRRDSRELPRRHRRSAGAAEDLRRRARRLADRLVAAGLRSLRAHGPARAAACAIAAVARSCARRRHAGDRHRLRRRRAVARLHPVARRR